MKCQNCKHEIRKVKSAYITKEGKQMRVCQDCFERIKNKRGKGRPSVVFWDKLIGIKKNENNKKN